MKGLTVMIEQFFWTMFWIVLALIAFVFISQWARNNNIPVVSDITTWAQSHAGLDQ